MTDPVNQEIPEAAVIKSIDELVARIIVWHKQGMDQANHMLEMPEGFESMYTGPDGVTVKLDLSGDVLKGFRMGILTGIDAFSNLPVAYVDAPTEAANEPTDDTPAE